MKYAYNTKQANNENACKSKQAEMGCDKAFSSHRRYAEVRVVQCLSGGHNRGIVGAGRVAIVDRGPLHFQLRQDTTREAKTSNRIDT